MEKISLTKLESYLTNRSPFEYELKSNSQEFNLSDIECNTFVEPEFSLVPEMSNCDDLKEAQIILIVAVGATGKTVLTKKLSYDLKFPIVDLGHTKVIAGNFLTGIIFKYLKPIDGGHWLQDIKDGKSGMIIDALDEGYQKTNTSGFFDFLDDVIENISSNYCSFIVLGRTNAVELASLHLDEKKIKVAVVQIEPFSLEKSKEFIDKQVDFDNIKSFRTSYIQTRDYVLDSLGGFFKTESSNYEMQRLKFIGYAPVLLAVSEFLKPKKVLNYKAVYEDLKNCNSTSISLILDVVDKILQRDKKDKINPNLLERIVKLRNTDFKERALKEAYTPEEQCARVLYILLGEPYPYKIIEDDDFEAKYCKGLETWMVEHPFLKERNPANVVFECYILAKLISNNRYKAAVFKYLRNKNVNSFIFFYLFKDLNKDKRIDAEIIPYLYNSLKTLDSKELNYSFEIEPLENDTKGLYAVSFIPSDLKEKVYDFITEINGALVWHGSISDISVDIHTDFVLDGDRINMFAPSYINCKNLIVKSLELNYSNREQNLNIIVETEGVKSDTFTGDIPEINGIGCNKESLSIISTECLAYPYSEYQKKKNEKEIEMSSDMEEAYKKMRKTLIMFRSHSKGQLARYKDKIDNRIGNTIVGKVVIDTLIKKHIIYEEKHLYVIDNNALAKYLGVKFDDIRNQTITKSMISFLRDIVDNIKSN